jgi:hypothetical protein
MINIMLKLLIFMSKLPLYLYKKCELDIILFVRGIKLFLQLFYVIRAKSLFSCIN